MTDRDCSRREFLVYGGAVGSLLGWLPFFRPGRVRLAGARFHIIRRGQPKRHFLVIHGDEETAREALARHLRSGEGIGFEIENHIRNVPINGGQIDPNRMFSRPGAEASLKKLNPDWSPRQIAAALDALDRGREKLIQALLPSKSGLLVALHNNSGDYSVSDEEPFSDQGAIPQPDDPHAFYLCTDPADFKILANSGYNIVLQQHGPEDGSLSRLCATRGVRYVNIEVRLGDLSRQMDMLNWLDWTLS